MKNRRGLIFLGLAIVLGIVAARMSTEVGDSGSSATPTGADMAQMVIVRTDVSVASQLSAEHLDTIAWPAEHMPPGALHSVDQAVGRVVRRPLGAGEPVTEISLFDVGASGGLRAVINDKMRAVSVKVDNVIGVAGFVTPGSHVDVLATIRRVDLERALPFAKVILQDVRVLAVDQKLEEVKSGEPELVNVVTLEVDPLQAEHLIYSAHEGRLQLALRSPGDDVNVANVSVGVADILGEAGEKPNRVASLDKSARKWSTVELVSGSTVEVKKF